MKITIWGSIFAFSMLFCTPTWAKFIVYAVKVKAGMSTCPSGLVLKEGVEIPASADGNSFRIKMNQGSELIVVDTRVKKSGQYSSWKIQAKANYGVCTTIKILVNGSASVNPSANASIKFDGYKNYYVLGNSSDTPEPGTPTPPNKPNKQIEVPVNVPKKVGGSNWGILLPIKRSTFTIEC